MGGRRDRASRSTWRPKVDVCWQKLKRDSFLAEGAPPVSLELKTARVREIGRALAESIILRYEWLGTMGSSGVFFGIFFGAYCAGVSCVAVNSTGVCGGHGAKQFGLGRDDLAILVRGACTHWAPPGTNSKLVSWTVRLLRGRGRVLMAFADEDAGEIGTIYQASGWTYIGPTETAQLDYVAPNGRILNVRNVGAFALAQGCELGRFRAFLLERGWRVQPHPSRHRYAVAIDRSDREVVAAIARLARPYPKRQGGGNISPGDTLSGEGGETPTPPLQLEEADSASLQPRAS